MQARYYDPVIGRFLSVDPVTFMDTGQPEYFNRYSYTANDPINAIDPDGMATYTLEINADIAVGTGGGASAGFYFNLGREKGEKFDFGVSFSKRVPTAEKVYIGGDASLGVSVGRHGGDASLLENGESGNLKASEFVNVGIGPVDGQYKSTVDPTTGVATNGGEVGLSVGSPVGLVGGHETTSTFGLSDITDGIDGAIEGIGNAAKAVLSIPYDIQEEYRDYD